MSREKWGSKIGFIFAAAGSAIGLANIWRFPYLVGSNGGAAFIFIYLICLALIAIPVFISEIFIGRTAQTNPAGAFSRLGGSNPLWKAGGLTILTGFIVSAFYSVVAGWILGYLFEAIQGHLTLLESPEQAATHFSSLSRNQGWSIFLHAAFLSSSLLVLYAGVKKGIEWSSKIFMPLLYGILTLLVVAGLLRPGAWEGVRFLFAPDWSALTPAAWLAALGQAFFTLSLGQGTMVTYGSYLPRNARLPGLVLPIVAMDTLVSLLASIAVFTLVFSVGASPTMGPSLIFNTLPLTFNQIPYGEWLVLVFFILIYIAALTSEISALEPSIAYLIDNRGWSRHAATGVVGLGAFLLGVPAAMSSSILEGMEGLVSMLLIPLGGLLAVLLVGWGYGAQKTADALTDHPILQWYFRLCFRWVAPALILLVFLNAF